MALEDQAKEIVSALHDLAREVKYNSELLEKILDGNGKDDEPARGRGRGRSADKDDEPARGRGRSADKDEGPARGRGRGRSADKDDEPARGRGRSADNKLTFDEFRAIVAKYLDIDDDEEFDRRANKVLGPIFDDYKARKADELPEKAWPEVLDAIEKDKADDDRRSRRGRV